jgi:hypothetical protein
MARAMEADAQPKTTPAFSAADWLEAHGLLHERGEGCDHCDNWTAHHWLTGRFTKCSEPRCVCVRRWL